MSQGTEKRSFVATYAFPPQDTKIKVGDRPKIALTLEPAGQVGALDVEAGLVTLKRGTAKGDFPDHCSLSPGSIIKQKPLIEAMQAFAERVAGGDFETDQAVLDFLRRSPPRLAGRQAGAPVIDDGEDLVDGTVRAVRDLDQSALIIQGPPGTGKTYTTAQAIMALLEDGKRVGVSSNSHKAIDNVLAAVSACAAERGASFCGVKKGSIGAPETWFTDANFETVVRSDEVLDHHELVGGTAFHFATDEPNAFDYLFVDEAGQVSLGNLIAMAGCARNLVLVGDQMQLPQPVQGVHPGETGLSTLDYAMQHHATAPPERGVLLNVSWRMHPDVCGLISQAIYEGRLTNHPRTALRRIDAGSTAHPTIKPTGISFVALPHQGCTQSSLEEALEIRTLVEELLTKTWVDEHGVEARLTLEGVLVVSPFNMQVNLLKKTLPAGARVGTVDKFQGQEAPVVIISMATSFGGDAPRGTEFLFNRNRLNVAISRAKCLAIVVTSERLLEVPSPGIGDLSRLSLLARIKAAALGPGHIDQKT